MGTDDLPLHTSRISAIQTRRRLTAAEPLLSHVDARRMARQTGNPGLQRRHVVYEHAVSQLHRGLCETWGATSSVCSTLLSGSHRRLAVDRHRRADNELPLPCQRPTPPTTTATLLPFPELFSKQNIQVVDEISYCVKIPPAGEQRTRKGADGVRSEVILSTGNRSETRRDTDLT